ncbi:MAG: twin transmembrane helix small protein [Rhodospirillaceae bacterium]|nr:twin transmembrane helix small protein [Rhodospirillaceae bacterium]MCA8931494.1 twin transmembrane helix small protein [Rhodospirillaceae bacterium]
MNAISLILMLVAMAAVLASLFGGLIAMARGGEFNRKYGNRFMRWRVMLQGLALLFFAIAVMSAGAG